MMPAPKEDEEEEEEAWPVQSSKGSMRGAEAAAAVARRSAQRGLKRARPDECPTATPLSDGCISGGGRAPSLSRRRLTCSTPPPSPPSLRRAMGIVMGDGIKVMTTKDGSLPCHACENGRGLVHGSDGEWCVVGDECVEHHSPACLWRKACEGFGRGGFYDYN